MAPILRIAPIFTLLIVSLCAQAQMDAAYSIKQSNTSACRSITVDFDPKSSLCPSGECDYLWDFGDGTKDTVAQNSAVSHTFNEDGKYTVSLQLKDRSTEDTSTTFYRYNVIKVYKPNVNFSDSVTTGGSYTKTLYQDSSNFKPFDADAWKYIWTVEDGGYYETYRQEPIIHQFDTDNTNPGYDVTLRVVLNAEDTDIIGYETCAEEVTQKVKVSDDFFEGGDLQSPDIYRLVVINDNSVSTHQEDERNSGINDFFFASNGKNILSVKIYNQWGSLVYKKKEITGYFSWLGNALNSDKYVPSGTYYFVISSDAEDERHNKKGVLQVINMLD